MIGLVIKIQVKDTFIPIEFGELNFKFDTSDESIQNFFKTHEETKKKMEETDFEEGKELEGARELLEESYDAYLGKGSFAKIYEQTPSALQLAGHFLDLSEGIAEQIEEMGLTESQQTKVDKYLQSKK